MRVALFALLTALIAPTLAASAARVLIKNSSPVTALAFAPDGRTLARADDDGGVMLFDIKSGRPRQSFRYKDAVDALAFAPNGRLLAIGVGRQIRLLDPMRDMKTARPVLVLRTSFPIYNPLQFSADGRVLLAIEGDHSDGSSYTVEVWDVTGEKRLRTYSVKDTDTITAALSPDGRMFVALTREFCSVFSVATGKVIRVLSDKFTSDKNSEVPYVSALAWSPDGKWIAGTGSYFEGPGHLTLWEAASGHLKWSCTFDDYGNTLAWSPSRSRVAVGTQYDTTYDDPGHLHRPTGAPIFAAPSGRWLRSLQRVPGDIKALAWSPDGKTLATGNNTRIELWDVER